MAKSMVEFTADWSQLNSVMGKIVGATQEFSSPTFATSVLKKLHSVSAVEFDTYMNALAKSNPKRFHHVYEWNRVGVPGYRLWRHRLIGTPNASFQTATYEFIPSVTPVPKPKVANLPARQKLKKYIFHAKATVMELGLPVTIKGRNGNRLFLPGIMDTDDRQQGYIYSDGPINVKNPGGKEVVGQFQGAWVAWWSTRGQQIFDEIVRPQLEGGITKIVDPIGRTIPVRSGRMATRAVRLDIDAMAAGRNEARLLEAKMRREARELLPHG